MRVLRFVRVLVALTVTCAMLPPLAARAQSAPSEIEVRVTDAASHPLGDARVYVAGPLSTSELTPRDGVIRFSDVDAGLYDIRVTLAGYDTVEAKAVEALPGQRKVIEIVLTRSRPKGAPVTPPPDLSGLKEIGRVTARPAVTVRTVDVDEDSPVRRISENLVDALDKLAGVNVIQGQQGNTLTISLRNADPTQTGTSIGGASVVGAAAGTLQAVAADLATGVSADASSNFGNVGGSVNFRTAQPTRTWQSQASFSYGTYEHTSEQLTLTGSLKKLGIAVQHAQRGGDSVLTGLRFADTSGETYVHDGAFNRDSDFLKLRYPVGRVTLTAQYLSGTTHNAPVCDEWVTVLPCGFGPGAETNAHAELANVLFQGQIGNVTVGGQVTGNRFRSLNDQRGRVVDGIPAPYSTDYRQSTLGFSDYSTVAVHRHTFLLNVGSYNGTGTLVTRAAFGGTAPLELRSAYTVVGDKLKFSDRWNATVAYGTNVSLAQTRSAADLSVVLTPSRQETLTFATGVYGGGSSYLAGNVFSDPGSATYDCASDAVTVVGPPDAPAAGIYNSTEIDYARRGRSGSIQLSAYDRLQRGGTFNAQFPITAVAGALPPGYLDALAGVWHQPALCGAQPFDPARVFISEQISGANVRYRGVDASGQLVLGRAVIAQGSYSTDAATLASWDPRFAGGPDVIGAQLPGRPLHRGNLLIDAIQRNARLEYVVNASWTSSNNAANLTPYVQVAAGATWIAPRGRLSFFVNNLFNADTGLFAATEFAQPLALAGGGTYVPIPTLLPPRTFTLLYSVRIDHPIAPAKSSTASTRR